MLLDFIVRYGMAQMRKATFTTTIPHLLLPIFAFSAESRSHIITLRFKFHETLQINIISNFLIMLLFEVCRKNSGFVISIINTYDKGSLE